MNDVEKEILLVKLPRILGIDQDYYGLGYYTDSGFSFCVLTEEMTKNYPVRDLPNIYKNSNEIEEIGIIKKLPKINKK